MAEIAVLVAPNIATIRTTTAEATTINEQEKFEEIKAAIDEAAAAGVYEVVIREDISKTTVNGKIDDTVYADILKNAGYNVCIGKYNDTEKTCTVIEWHVDENGNRKDNWKVDEDGKIVEA